MTPIPNCQTVAELLETPEGQSILRDVFAGIALISVADNDYTFGAKSVAETSYRIADAMLVARKANLK